MATPLPISKYAIETLARIFAVRAGMPKARLKSPKNPDKPWPPMQKMAISPAKALAAIQATRKIEILGFSLKRHTRATASATDPIIQTSLGRGGRKNGSRGCIILRGDVQLIRNNVEAMARSKTPAERVKREAGLFKAA